MSEFVRARSAKNKQLRMQEIMDATDLLFKQYPYHEITLTTIAEQLSWTRANLYKYVSTKEEIFLALTSQKMDLYFSAMLSAFPKESQYSIDVFAKVWASILNAHKDYLHYSDILSTIIETNVSVDRLADFKINYYQRSGELSQRLGHLLSISQDEAYQLFLAVHYHAVGIYSLCLWNPLVHDALMQAHIEEPKIDFLNNLEHFIYVQLSSIR